MSGGEQAERRRSGETTLNKVRTQIKPYTIRVEKSFRFALISDKVSDLIKKFLYNYKK